MVDWELGRSSKLRTRVRLSSFLVLVLDQATGGFEIGPDHLLDERIKVDPSLPAEYAFGFSRITEEKAGFFFVVIEMNISPRKKKKQRTRLLRDGNSEDRL